MSEEKIVSNKLDIEAKRLSANSEENNKEFYKAISEDILLDNASGETLKTMVRENGDTAQDGADEKMLGTDGDKEALALKNIEVKFISGDQNLNGDAKIEIGGGEKTFTGMTKEELMKYANDPFWVKLRWFIFICFWIVWIAMLLGAIAIIIYAPKCAAPTPLSWWKKGPLVEITGNEEDTVIEKMKEMKVQGVVYELSSEDTYFVDKPEVEEKIKNLVNRFSVKDIQVVLDLTPNYVTQDDPLFKEVKNSPDGEASAAFIISDKEYNWKKFNGTESAWQKLGNKYFLSQFGNNIDLRLDSSVGKNKFLNVLSHLVKLGVKGFRLTNAKFFITSTEFKDEPIGDTLGKNMQDYEFYKHDQTTYREGLGDLINSFRSHVKTLTNDEGFLSVTADVTSHTSVFLVKGTQEFGMDLPRFGFINHELKDSGSKTAKSLHNSFANINTLNLTTPLWMQLPFNKQNFRHLNQTAYLMFVGLLPGVEIAPLNSLIVDNSTELKIEKIRETHAFQHGFFNFYLSNDANVFAYSRIKSGNPGYFVVVNPTTTELTANFTLSADKIVGSELSTQFVSGASVKNKMSIDKVEMPQLSTAIFTFVPK